MKKHHIKYLFFALICVIVLVVISRTDAISIVNNIVNSGNFGIKESISRLNGKNRYIILFILSAAPVIEIVMVTPIAVAVGLNPLFVSLVAFCANIISIYVTVKLYQTTASRLGYSYKNEEFDGLARIYWDRYGLPGLSISSPWLLGTRASSIIALGLGSDEKRIFFWMIISVLFWSFATSYVSYHGISLITNL